MIYLVDTTKQRGTASGGNAEYCRQFCFRLLLKEAYKNGNLRSGRKQQASFVAGAEWSDFVPGSGEEWSHYSPRISHLPLSPSRVDLGSACVGSVYWNAPDLSRSPWRNRLERRAPPSRRNRYRSELEGPATSSQTCRTPEGSSVGRRLL